MSPTQPEASGEERISLAEAARRVELSVEVLRRAVQQGRLPAEKSHGAWSVLPGDLLAWQSLRQAGLKRARATEEAGFEDEQRRLSGVGVVAAPPAPEAEVSLEGRARQAAADAIDHQLNPEASQLGAPPRRLSGRQTPAQAAEREALDDILHRPSAPHPPERSL